MLDIVSLRSNCDFLGDIDHELLLFLDFPYTLNANQTVMPFCDLLIDFPK